MMSPLVRTWLAARLPDWADHAYAIWRGLLAAFGGREWDPCQIDPGYTRPPAPVEATVAAGQPGTAPPPSMAPSPASNPRWRPWRREYMLRVCRTDLGGCGARIGADCTTADGRVTRRPHTARRQP